MILIFFFLWQNKLKLNNFSLFSQARSKQKEKTILLNKKQTIIASNLLMNHILCDILDNFVERIRSNLITLFFFVKSSSLIIIIVEWWNNVKIVSKFKNEWMGTYKKKKKIKDSNLFWTSWIQSMLFQIQSTNLFISLSLSPLSSSNGKKFFQISNSFFYKFYSISLLVLVYLS